MFQRGMLKSAAPANRALARLQRAVADDENFSPTVPGGVEGSERSVGGGEIMTDRVQIAIIGAGPGDVAAAHAAERRFRMCCSRPAITWPTRSTRSEAQDVMARPGCCRCAVRPSLRRRHSRSDPRRRGRVNSEARRQRQAPAAVTAITGIAPAFDISLAGGDKISAEAIVLGIGLQAICAKSA